MSSLIQNGRILFKFVRGALTDQITVDRMNSFIEANNMNRITSVVGGSFRRSLNGTTIVVQPSTPVGGGGVSPQPWDLVTYENDPVDTNINLYVRLGNFAGVIPVNHATVFSLSKSLTYYIYLTVSTVDGGVSSVTLYASTTIPTPPAATPDVPPSTVDYIIGILKDGVPHKAVSGGVFSCVPIESFREEKVSFTAGELPYTIYYNWKITQS